MKTKESIFEVFDREICSNCKKNKTCQEELRIRIDNSIKCYEYERIDKDVIRNKTIIKGIEI